MKKVILFSLALCLLAVPASAKKGKPAKAVMFVMEQQKELEKQPNENINVRCTISQQWLCCYQPEFCAQRRSADIQRFRQSVQYGCKNKLFVQRRYE